MKVIELGQEALEAQGLVLQRLALRIGRRVAYFVIAAVFGLFAAVSLHGLLWAFALDVLHFSALESAASVLGFDLLIVVIFGLLGMRRVADPVEFEAKVRRDRKFLEFKQAFALSTLTGLLFGPLGRFAGRKAAGGVRNIFTRR
ncbi:phage holin family protein [Acidomonas methanolica]|nr:phage holin family protein [Acidomonas methanolica]